jgi:hypothetical protein
VPGPILEFEDRLVLEQIRTQLLVERLVVPAQPLEHHGGVLLLLVAVVGEDRAQLVIAGGGDALVVPVDGFELLHDRDDRAMAIDGFR